MYLRQNMNNQKPFQIIQFLSLKKKHNSYLLSIQNNKIILNTNTHQQATITILTILGIYEFTTNPIINQQIFTTFNLQHSPKSYQSYTHQKTMKALLKILIDNSQSQKYLVQFINQFPILIFILEAYCRAILLNAMKENKNKELNGNDKEIVENFNLQIRGQLLQLMSNTLGIHITLICGQFTQFYGQNSYHKKIQIKYTENQIEAELISPKRSHFPTNHIKSNQNSATKTLKQIHSLQTETSQSQQISSIESNSLLNSNMVTSQIARCQKCKLLKNRCFCSKKVISGYDTPKSAAKNQRNPTQIGPNSNMFSSLNHSKCVCHKLVCTCRK